MEGFKEVIVLDASTVVKWFVEEEYTGEALKIREDYINRLIDAVAPEILPFEVLNALRYNPEFGEKDLKEAAKALERYDFWLFPILGGMAEKVIRNALKFGISIYDSSYISLAEERGATLYTADEKLLAKLRGCPYARHVSEYAPKL